MIYRLIAPDWALQDKKVFIKVLEGEFKLDDIHRYNKMGYNIYYLPNYPSSYTSGKSVDGSMVDTFSYVFVDCDLKDGLYESKDAFLEALGSIDILPTKIVDSGNGIHAYWRISNLDAMSYLRFQRRLLRTLHTDEAVGQLFQLMRLPGTINTKLKDTPVDCVLLGETDSVYTSEQLDKLLPPITMADEAYCKQHYDKTYGLNQDQYNISDEMPPKFGKLLRDNLEVKELWAGNTDDRSKNDYRLGHIMFANGFTKEEAASVLVNSSKALTRSPVHRTSYATNIIDKIWTFELAPDKEKLELSSSVREILQRSNGELEGKRFPSWSYIDNTEAGFRLGHVMGLVAGSGVGKTAMALNLFLGFVASNPEYDHFFCPLEQTDKEIASRWNKMCGDNPNLHSKVHIISNYDEAGKFRDLSLDDLKSYILKFKESTGKKIGCVVIDHIGILCNNNKLGQDEGVKQISKAMKSFAIETDTFLIMQSQTSREKAGIGDLELNKDAAFGTSVFENFCDYLVTLWQPLKRVYAQGAPTIMAFKFCKIRHKKQGVDKILEDVPYTLFFNPETQLLRELSQDEETSFKYYVSIATNNRKSDRKTDIISYTSAKWEIPNAINISRPDSGPEIRKTNLPKSENRKT